MKRRFWERTDKGGSSTGSFDSRGRVSSLFFSCSFLCRRRLRISSFFFIEEEEVNDDDVVWKEQTLGKIPAIHFFETESSTSGSLTRSKASVFLFFWLHTTSEGNAIYIIALHFNLQNVSASYFAQPIMTLGSSEIDRSLIGRDVTFWLKYIIENTVVFLRGADL